MISSPLRHLSFGLIAGLLGSFFISSLLEVCAIQWSCRDDIDNLGTLEVSDHQDFPFTIDTATMLDGTLTLTWHTDDGRSGTVSWQRVDDD